MHPYRDVVHQQPLPSAPVSGFTPEAQSYNPTWTSGGCVTKASALLAEPFTFWLTDVDVVSDDSITAVLQYQLTESDFASGSLSFQPSGGMEALTVQLQRQ